MVHGRWIRALQESGSTLYDKKEITVHNSVLEQWREWLEYPEMYKGVY